MAGKIYRIAAAEMKPLAMGYGGCIATDRITVDGARVGYCCRAAPHNDLDSGWRFFAGDEDDAYMATTEFHAVYDINTIANYDADIIALIEAPQGSAFERGDDGRFVDISDETG